MRSTLFLAVLLTCVSHTVPAQTLFARYEAQTTRFQADQPKWMVPVVSPYPMLIQVFRADFTRQITPALVHNWNFGTTRGLNLIPLKNTEVDILVPPFMEHGDTTKDGFGDFAVTGKYRLLAGNEQHGNYLLSGQAQMTFPTGSYKNGTTKPTVTPTLMGGKGFGKFDAFTTLGGTLPTGSVNTLGRTLVSNSVFQYHARKYLYPEVEINSTRYFGATRDGKIQTFITPGLVVGKYALRPHESGSRVGLVAGFGFQIAATQYHLYNHAAVVTSRFIF